MHFVFCQVSTNLINAELPDDKRFYNDIFRLGIEILR